MAYSPAFTFRWNGRNAGAPCFWAIHYATRMPSTAAEVMPPANPAPSPHG